MTELCGRLFLPHSTRSQGGNLEHKLEDQFPPFLSVVHTKEHQVRSQRGRDHNALAVHTDVTPYLIIQIVVSCPCRRKSQHITAVRIEAFFTLVTAVSSCA